MGTTFQLSLDEVHRALDELDPVNLVTAELTGRTTPEPAPVTAAAAVDLHHAAPCQAVLENPSSQTRFLVPLEALRALRDAGLAAVAARLFVPPGAATVSVLGSGLPAELLLRVVARFVLATTHVAVCAPAGPADATVTRRVVDEFDLSGISLAVTPRVDEAAFGANLIVIVDSRATDLRIEWIAKGAVLVNASGWDLPGPVVGSASRVYVDNLRLIGDNLHRHFIRAHLAPRRTPPASCRDEPRSLSISGDLGGLLLGGPLARPDPEEVVLVEVLGAGTLSSSLGNQLARAAQRLGLGEQIG